VTCLAVFPAGSGGAAVIALIVVLAVGALVWAVATAFTRERRPQLSDTLAPYTVGQIAERAGSAGPKAGATKELVTSPLLQRAVDKVAEFASQRGLLQYVEAKLEQANLPVRPAEMLFFYLVAVVVGGVVGLLGGVVVAIVLAVVLAVAPWMALDGVAKQRTKKFTSQLPDMLQLLATTLRSGFSILQGLDTVSRQLPEPIGEEMRQVVTEARLGRPVVEALDDVAKRVRSDDFDWVVQAIAIQREVGGNLAELLDIVADTMQERERVRREVRTLTAEGRIGAVIITILPVLIGVFVWVTNRSYLQPLFHNTAGEIAFYGSIGLAVVGIVWLRRIIEIEI
jgi:tight adherence protein B